MLLTLFLTGCSSNEQLYDWQSANERITTLEQKIETLEYYVETLQDDYDNLFSEMYDLKDELNLHEWDRWSIIDATSTMEAVQEQLLSDVDDLEDTIGRIHWSGEIY
jgi:uncharacterized protein YhaN